MVCDDYNSEEDDSVTLLWR